MNAKRFRCLPATRILAALVLLLALAAACAPPPARRTRSVKKGTITEVLAARTGELMAIPGVIGTGEGSENGERVFVVFVNHRTPELDAKLPREIDGYAVVVREAGDVTAPPR